jgi:hypothetical protein
VSERPNYLKYAFANVYNLGLLGAAGVASAGTGDWAIAVIAGGAEALWLLIGADTAPFRRWVDTQHRTKMAEEAKVRRRNRIIALASAKERERAIELVAAYLAMGRELEKNEHWSGELVRDEYSRLDSLLDAFVELAEAAQRFETYGRQFDLNSLRRELAAQKKLAATPGLDAVASGLATQNADLLQKRIAMLEEMERLVQRTRGQMSVIENTFRLLRDQIVSLQPPQDIHRQLDEIVAGVDAVRAVLAQGDEQLMSAPPAADAESAEASPRNRVRS